jgi:dihydrofolate reductase
VRALREEGGRDLLLVGSPAFAQTLIRNDLIDEYRLMIDPIVLGGGKRLFQEASEPRRLRLVESQPTSTGAILATYAEER